MDARLVEFAEVLRQNGVRVSPAEVEDAVRATVEVGLVDRELFKSALASTMVKRALDLEPFGRAFEFFFSGAAKTFSDIGRSLARRIEEQGLLEGDELAMVLATMGQLVGGMSALGRAALEGDAGSLAQLFRGASLQLDLKRYENFLQTGFYARRLMTAAGGAGMRSELKTLERELAARGLSAQGLEIVSRELVDAMRRVEDAGRRELERQGTARHRPQSGGIRERSFHLLSPQEILEAQTAVKRVAEKLKSRFARKRRQRRRGVLAVHRTLRRNLPWGGVPMVPIFRAKRPSRPEVVILCDISDSVRNASRLMLLFTHTLQSLFARVRSFVFVSEVGEVTRLFKALDVNEAIELAVSGQAVSVTSNSNYGHALAQFVREQLGSITRRTTVLVIGDARNNFNPNSAWALKDLKRKARRVVWINPEDKSSWALGDSEMRTYESLVSQALVVRSIDDLSRVADEIV